MTEQRRLAAILVADVVGYSKLVGSDEAGTLAQLRALQTEIIGPAISNHAGRLFKAMGDGFLVEFASAVQAVEAAQAIQQANAEGKLPLRIGIHVGDVVVQGDDLMGDGVNIAARIEGVAEPGGIALSRQVHDQVRDRLDIAFTDKGEIELKNIQRPVQVFVIGGAKADGQVTALPLPDKPSIAVLPFQNMSGDPEQEYFVDGLVEDIITALSRFKSLFVIARNSSFVYKGKAVDIKQVGRELGVRYVLEGSVRKAANRVRITAQLIESQADSHLWADRIDGALEDIFDLQDEVTEKVIAALAPSVEHAEIERAQRKSTAHLGAYDCYLRALDYWRLPNRENTNEATRLLRKALELDPTHSSALGLLLAVSAHRRGLGMVTDAGNEKAEVERLVQRAVRIGGEDAVALAHTAWAIAYVLHDLRFALEQVQQALTLNPNLASAWAFSGWIHVWSGDPAEAVEHLSRSARLDPIGVTGPRLAGLAHAYFFLERYEESLDVAESLVRRNPDAHPALRIAAASAAFAGRTKEANLFAARLRDLDPLFRLSGLEEYLGPYRPAAFREKYREGLRMAGLPE